MGISSEGRGPNTHSIKIVLGYHPVTGQRRYYTETFKGAKRAARLREAELIIQARDKKLVPSSEITFAECFNRYCDEARLRLSISRFKSTEVMVRLYLSPSIGDRRLKDLVKGDFQKVYDSMTIRGLSPGTVHTLHSVTRAVVTWALEKKLLSEDILRKVKLPKIPKVKPEYLNYKETQDFFDEAPNYWYGNAFKFQLVTGLRNQELMALMWEDIDFEEGKVEITRACIWQNTFKGFKGTKNGEGRTIALDTPAINLLKRVKAAQEAHIKQRRSSGLSYGNEHLVFCTKDGRVPNISAVRVCFKVILKKIGITRRFRWYGARHTHATHLLDNQGANPKMIANRMGHSPEMLFRTYGHEMKGQQLEALSKISARVTL
jgi:integrase